MRKTPIVHFLIALVLGGCATPWTFLPENDGGKLYVTKKSATDGFFLWGDLKYTKKHLVVSAWPDAASSTTRMYFKYANTGGDGIRLHVTCNWMEMDGHTPFPSDSREEYQVVLFPYSHFIVRQTAWQEAQKHLSYSCEHKETLSPLYNRKIQRNYAEE